MKKVVSILLLAFALSVLTYANDFNGYIVRIKDNTLKNLGGASMLSDRANLFSDMDDSDVVELLAQEFSDVSEINSDHMLVTVTDEAALQELIDLGIVENYEKNYYAELYGYDYYANSEYLYQKWYLDAVNVGFAWNAGIFGNDVKVAVIDSGVYPNNDIKSNILQGRNYVVGGDQDDTADVTSIGHGTGVAGIIASQCNNIGTVGVSFKTKIVPLKVTNDMNVALNLIVEAIYDAVELFECDVINLSLGMKSDSSELRNAVNYALSRGVIVVAAAGNDGSTGYRYPASYDGVISVANAEKSGNVFRIYSSSQKNDMIDVAAPGTDIITLDNSATGTKYLTGTSFSAPVVSAAAALAKSVDPSIDSYRFESLVRRTADASYKATSGQDSNAWGMGMLDIEAFIKDLVKSDYYVSDKLTIADKTSVYITNFTDTPVEKGTVIVSQYDDTGTLVSVSNMPLSLGANSSYEFVLTDYGFAQSSKVSFVGNRIPGDVNNDGYVTLLDASAIMRYLAGYTVTIVDSALDVDGDGSVSLRDASSIMRYLAGYNVVLN